MPNPLSVPKLAVSIDDMVYPKTRLQRSVNLKNTPAADPNQPELRATCLQMESVFLYHLLKEMRATIHKTGFISGGRAEEIYTSMMDAEIANKISTRGSMGLADMLFQQLVKRVSLNETDEPRLP